MIIDGHAHACGEFLRPERILRTLDENGVDRVVLVPGELNSERNYKMPDLAARFPGRDVVSITNRLTRVAISLTRADRQIDAGNEFVAGLARAHPDRIIQFYWVRLRTPEHLELLESRHREWRFKGLKLHQCWEHFRVSTAAFQKVAGWASERGLPIFIHLYNRRGVLELIDYIRDHPQAVFIIGHLFGLKHYMASVRDFENVYFEVSTPQLVSKERLEQAVRHFGARRIIFGSDVPYGLNNQAVQLKRIRALPISDADRDLILGGNMQRLLETVPSGDGEQS